MKYLLNEITADEAFVVMDSFVFGYTVLVTLLNFNFIFLFIALFNSYLVNDESACHTLEFFGYLLDVAHRTLLLSRFSFLFDSKTFT